MIEHAVEIEIERPLEEAFAFLADAANHPRAFREVRRMGPRRMEILERSGVAR